MLIAIFTAFAASKTEPLADMAARVHAAFLAAGFPEPSLRFACSDPPALPRAAALGGKRVSAVERAVKRWPELGRFARTVEGPPEAPGERRYLTNEREDGTLAPVAFALFAEMLSGVPRSLPFHSVSLHFAAPGFSQGPDLPANPDPRTLSTFMRAGVDIGAGHPTSAGVAIKDSWWVNGRNRVMGAMRIVEADPAAKTAPAPPPTVAGVYAACGKARKSVQIPVHALAGPGAPQQRATSDPATPAPAASPRFEAIQAIVRDYRARMPELLARMPYDLPQNDPERAAAGLPAGPKKPPLVEAFAPLGYDCRGETGAFTLRRRTPGHLTVKLTFDVGTWSDRLKAIMQVQGLADGHGYNAILSLPASPSAARGVVNGVAIPAQFPIGGAERWRKIVANLAVLVGELDRGMVPEIEAVAGPSPAWHEPG